jgi:hypothetical protein
MENNQPQIGTIISASTTTASCQFVASMRTGEVIYFHYGKAKVPAKVVYLYNSPHRGLVGNVVFLDQVKAPPAASTALFLDGSTRSAPGVYIEVGKDTFDNIVTLRLNAIFRNLLMTGKTQSGKTHAAIVLAEEFIRLKVPNVIFDTQNEFTGLSEKFGDQVELYADNVRAAKLLTTIRQRKTAIISMMGMAEKEKMRIVADLLWAIYKAKEQSYTKDAKFYPPVILTVDEIELYAPTHLGDPQCANAIENVLKRGAKFGIGSLLISQRLPNLDPDVRSQCNSAMMFLLDDPGSINTIRLLAYVTRYDIAQVRALNQGECVITGAIVPNPIKVKVREIQVHRTKNVDFEQLLDLAPEVPPDNKMDLQVPELDDKEQTKVAEKVFAALTEKGDEAWTMADVVNEGKSTRELAQTTGVPEKHVALGLGRISNLDVVEVGMTKYYFRTQNSQVLSVANLIKRRPR